MNELYEKIRSGEEALSLVGLGYVGMPIAIEFAKRGVKVIGFDINAAKIETYRSGIDPTHEVGDKEISETTVHFTSDERDLRLAKFHIVAVPTPVNDDHTPRPHPGRGRLARPRQKSHEGVGSRLRVHGIPRRHRGRLRTDTRARVGT